MIADLKPYAEYKESDAPWFGEVPRHWEVKRLGSVFSERSETNEKYEVAEVLSVLKDIGVIPYSEKGRIGNKKSEDIGRYKIVRPDDLVVNCMNVIIGSVGRSRYTGCLSPVYYVLKRRKPEHLPRYLELVFQHKSFQRSLVRIGNGILAHRMRIPMEKLKAEPFPLPPPDEQAAIVRFLDWANGRLERAIRAKRKVIALLNEQKQAIIHRAVTRGLDPSVPLKPSGIPWLGDIPQHWEVRRLKSLCRFVTSGSRGWARYYADAGFVFLRIGNISTTSVDLRLKRLTYVTPPDGTEGERTRAIADDLLLSITAQIGAVGVVPNGLGEAFVNQHTALIRLRQGASVPRWVAYGLLSSFGKDQCRLMTNGGTKVGLTLDDVRCLVVLLPPLEEQAAIVAGIERQTGDLDSAISRLEREIELLREYRTRLVADVVTGKLDVRAAALLLPDEAPPDTAEDAADLGDEIESEAEGIEA